MIGSASENSLSNSYPPPPRTPPHTSKAVVHYEMSAIRSSRLGAHKESVFSYKKMLELLEKGSSVLNGYNSIVQAALPRRVSCTEE